MTRRILITGGKGYVGGRLARHLAADPANKLYLGSRDGLPAAWLPEAAVIGMQWSDGANLDAACAGVDAIVHCAAMNEQACRANPALALEVNAINTVRLVAAAQRAKVRRFVYLSTAQVYGAPLAGRIDEGNVPRAANAYASSHRAAEDVVLQAHDGGAMDGVVVRLSNGFGAPAHPEADCWMLLANNLCRQAVRDRKLVLRSSGLQWRDFIPLAEACRALAHLLTVDRAALGDAVFNLGSAPARVIELAQRIQARAGAVLGYEPLLSRPDPSPGESWPPLDYRAAKLATTGFVPAADMDGEIDAMLRFCSTHFAPGG